MERFSRIPAVNPSLADASKVVFLTPYERRGVIAMAFAGTVSCILVTSLLLTISLPALFSARHKPTDASTPFTSKQIAVFVICLFCSDLIQSISGIIQVKWAAESRLSEGTACSIQAATLVMGDLGSTVWSCVIAAHTFSGLALTRQWSRRAVVSTVVTGWTFVITLTIVGPVVLEREAKGPFFSIAGTWCFISSEYAVARLVIHYIPLFVAAAVILVFYGIVFLVLLGTISFTQNQHPSLPLGDEITRQRAGIAKRMLWYPIVYLTCILPISVTRLIGMQDDDLPQGVWIFGMFFLFSLGAADSVIYATTRHIIRPPRSLSLSARLNTFNDTRSSWGVGVSNNNSNSSGVDNDKTSCEEGFNMGEEDASVPVDQVTPDVLGVPGDDGGAKDLRRDARRYGIYVTLDRIQEVILVSLGRSV